MIIFLTLTDILYDHTLTDILYDHTLTDILYGHTLTGILYDHTLTDILYDHTLTSILYGQYGVNNNGGIYWKFSHVTMYLEILKSEIFL